MKLITQHIELKVEVRPGFELRFVFDGKRIVTFDEGNVLRHLEKAEQVELMNELNYWVDSIDTDFTFFVRDVIEHAARAIPGNNPPTT